MTLHSFYLVLAIFFGFIMAWGIGANDVSNAMGASVGSKAISIRQAIFIAAIFEFLGSFLAGSAVTQTVQQGIIDLSFFTTQPDILIIGMLASLLSAGSWLMIASIFGWPVSTTHTIVGAIVGFGVAHIGFDVIQWHTLLSILFGWLISPFLGAGIAYSLFSSTQFFIFNKIKPFGAAKKVVPYYIFITCCVIYMITLGKLGNFGIEITKKATIGYTVLLSTITAYIGHLIIKRISLDPEADINSHYTNVERIFSILMIFTACAMAFAHGSNDVANAIGPVAAIVNIIDGNNSAHIPAWILLLGASGIVLGLTMYGYKVIATVGSKITQLTPSRGFSTTLAAAITVVLASSSGLPISTTHTLVGGILGIGLARGIHALNLGVIRSIFMSWLITLPAGAGLSIVFFYILKLIFTGATL